MLKRSIGRRARVAAFAGACLLALAAWSSAATLLVSPDVCSFGSYTVFYGGSTGKDIVGVCDYPCFGTCTCTGEQTDSYSTAYYPCAPPPIEP